MGRRVWTGMGTHVYGFVTLALSALLVRAAVAQSCPVWTMPPAGAGPAAISTMVVHNNRIVVRGAFTTVSGIPAAGIAEYDGGGASGWTPMSAGWTTNMAQVTGRGGIASLGVRLYASGRRDNTIEHADAAGKVWDGQAWSAWPATGLYPGTTFSTRAVYAAGGAIIADGEFLFASATPDVALYRRSAAWNGSSWVPLSPTYGLNINGADGTSKLYCASRYNGQVYIGGQFFHLSRGDGFNQSIVPAGGICVWDGAELQPLPNGGLNGTVTGMAVYQDELYVVGNFTGTQDGQVALNSIASFDGAWHPVAGGISQFASALLTADDGSGEKLHIISGQSGQATAYNAPLPTTDSFNYVGVVRWNGLRFEPLGVGAQYAVSGTVSGGVAFDSGAGPSIVFSGAFAGGGGPSRRYGRWGPGVVSLPDADQDGIPDAWEQGPMDVNCDGTADLDLSTMGANWRHKDVFVEVDSMAGRAPTLATLNQVVAAFAAVPNEFLDNPDGLPGITLHIVFDAAHQTIPLQNFPNDFVDFHPVKAEYFGTAADRASPNRTAILQAKKRVFRYCIFGNTYGGTSSSGLAEIAADDFMVTLGGFRERGGTPTQQAATFMHELGHTLGLEHGGHQEANYKPNYHSIMNYSWQLNHHVPGWVLDYSRQTLPTLFELALDESMGVGGWLFNSVLAGPFPRRLVGEVGPVDWNRNGQVDPGLVSADINYCDLQIGPSPGEALEGSEDWSRLQYNFRNSPNYATGDSPYTTKDVCVMTRELAEDLIVATGGNIGGCPADLGVTGGAAGQDGLLDNNDFIVLIDYFFAGDPRADFGSTGGEPGADGLFNNNDFVVYIGAFFTGCP